MANMTARRIKLALRYAEAYLGVIFDNELRGLFPGDSQVAVIGGCIRDIVLSQLSHTHGVVPTFRDLDIAVLSPKTLTYVYEIGRDVQSNRYGGLKLSMGGLRLDLWHWKEPPASVVSNNNWEQWLEQVDFSINAIAFLWPAKRIINHASWERALVLRDVSALTVKPISRHRDALRAFGLQCRMQLHNGNAFTTSQAVLNEVDWLLAAASSEERTDAVNYLVTLTQEGRYPVNCIELLQRLVIREIGLDAWFSLAELIRNCEIAPRLKLFSSYK